MGKKPSRINLSVSVCHISCSRGNGPEEIKCLIERFGDNTSANKTEVRSWKLSK